MSTKLLIILISTVIIHPMDINMCSFTLMWRQKLTTFSSIKGRSKGKNMTKIVLVMTNNTVGINIGMYFERPHPQILT